MTGYRITGRCRFAFYHAAEDKTEYRSEPIDQVVSGLSGADAAVQAISKHLAGRRILHYDWEHQTIEAVGDDVLMRANGQPTLFGDDI